MLLGYDQTGEIKFIFTDERYLEEHYPNNTAKIDNFWPPNHGLTELFIPIALWGDFGNKEKYKIKNGKLVLKTQDEMIITDVIKQQGLFVKTENLLSLTPTSTPVSTGIIKES